MQNGQKYESEDNFVQAWKQYKLALTVDPQNNETIEKRNRLEKNARTRGRTLPGKYEIAGRGKV